MIREFDYNIASRLDEFVFDIFQIDKPGSKDAVSIWNYSAITPDSFIWMMVLNKTVYYLYAEDFVQSLEQIEKSIRGFTKSTKGLEFIKVKKTVEFEDASPVKVSQVYEYPEDYDTLKLYASESGYHFVFLARSDQDPEEAYFTEAIS